MNQLSRDVFRQLIEINTTDSAGNTTLAAEAMAKRLRDAGFPASDVQVLGPNDRKGNLVARFRGTGSGRPILLIGHLDVVEARREDWSTDPFQFIEKDGYYYGRGTQDMKSGDAIFVATFLRLKKESYRPSRDLILALTADEEGGRSNGVDWLLKNHRDLIDADFVLNADGGGVYTRNGKPAIVTVDAKQKSSAPILHKLTVTNSGGHSSLPVKDNAIYRLSDALSRVEHYEFPFELNAALLTRAVLRADRTHRNGENRRGYEGNCEESAQRGGDRQAFRQSPLQCDHADHLRCYAARCRPRQQCAATNGSRQCELPHSTRSHARGGAPPAHRDSGRSGNRSAATSPTRAKIFRHRAQPPRLAVPLSCARRSWSRLKKFAHTMWPGAPVIPTMATGASDGVYTNAAGLPTYRISGLAIDFGDVRAHGRDERLGIASYNDGVEFYERYIRALTSSQ